MVNLMLHDFAPEVTALFDRYDALLDKQSTLYEQLSAELDALVSLIDDIGSVQLKQEAASWLRGLKPPGDGRS
jgi:hypothetical protein